jgi:hypothetical protein
VLKEFNEEFGLFVESQLLVEFGDGSVIGDNRLYEEFD